MNLTPEQLQDIGSVLADAMSLYLGSRETPDYAVRVARLIADAETARLRLEAFRRSVAADCTRFGEPPVVYPEGWQVHGDLKSFGRTVEPLDHVDHSEFEERERAQREESLARAEQRSDGDGR